MESWNNNPFNDGIQGGESKGNNSENNENNTQSNTNNNSENVTKPGHTAISQISDSTIHNLIGEFEHNIATMTDAQKAQQIFAIAQKLLTHLIIKENSYPLVQEQGVMTRSCISYEQLSTKHQKELYVLLQKYKHKPDFFINAPRYHQFSVEEHTQRVYQNLSKYEAGVNAKLNINLEKYFSDHEINLLKTYTIQLHDIAKLYPIFLVQECRDLDRDKTGKKVTTQEGRTSVKTAHYGHETSGAALLHRELFGDQMKQKFNDVYAQQILRDNYQKVASTLTGVMTEYGLDQEAREFISLSVGLHFEAGSIRKKLYNTHNTDFNTEHNGNHNRDHNADKQKTNLYTLKGFAHHSSHVKEIITQEMKVLQDKFTAIINTNDGSPLQRLYQKTGIKKILYIIARTFLRDNLSKINEFPELDHTNRQEVYAMQQHIESLVSHYEGDTQKISDIYNNTHGLRFPQKGSNTSNTGQKKYGHFVINGIKDYHQMQHWIRTGGADSFSFDKNHEEFLHPLHMRCYQRSIEYMYINYWISQEMFAFIHGFDS